MKKYILYLIPLSFLVVSCQSLKKEVPNVKDSRLPLVGQWEAKTMIKSMETGEASIVNLDLLGQSPDLMRLEVTTSLGIALASVVLKTESIEYFLPRQKKYYHGVISDTALFPILKIKVDPKLLLAAFFEKSYPNWACKADNGMIESCTTSEGVLLKWDREDKLVQRIIITSPAFEVQIQIKKYTEKSAFPEKALLLKVPDSYKRFELK